MRHDNSSKGSIAASCLARHCGCLPYLDESYCTAYPRWGRAIPCSKVRRASPRSKRPARHDCLHHSLQTVLLLGGAVQDAIHQFAVRRADRAAEGVSEQFLREALVEFRLLFHENAFEFGERLERLAPRHDPARGD